MHRVNSKARIAHICSAVEWRCSYLLAHLSRRLIGELLVYRGIRRPSSVRRQHFQMTSSLKPLGRFFSYFSCAIYCCATADILTKLLQQCFLFFIVVVILGHNLGNSQVSSYRTIGPTLVTLNIII